MYFERYFLIGKGLASIMKQLFQCLKSGEMKVLELPAPAISDTQVLVEVIQSLVSPGTERMLLEFGKSSLLGKLQKQPEKARQALQKIRTDGLLETYAAVDSKLSQLLPLGYSNVGIVKSVGRNVFDINVGDRVVTNGYHAGVVAVSANLCAKIPASVSYDQASFAVIGAVALHAIRLSVPTLGETFLVVGAGLVGLLAIQILKANGCSVIAVDLEPDRLKLAEQFGATAVACSSTNEAKGVIDELTEDLGVDGVLVCVASSSDQPLSLACNCVRDRGRVVIVGTVGPGFSRDILFRKEITLLTSRSYGPGRYNYDYEIRGNDFPVGYVRWTVKRNFETLLNLFERGSLSIDKLITARVLIDNVTEQYPTLVQEHSLGIVLDFTSEALGVSAHSIVRSVYLESSPTKSCTVNKVEIGSHPVVGLIGAGDFVRRTLLPSLKSRELQLHTIAANSGLRSAQLAEKYNFKCVTTDVASVIQNPQIDSIFIATNHESHATLVLDALQAGKNVFVEKPLCITPSELNDIKNHLSARKGLRQALLLGFNRRFSPLGGRLKSICDRMPSSKTVIYTVNAGRLDRDSWILDKKIGGGRLIGESCHFVDFIRFLFGCGIVEARVTRSKESLNDYTFLITLKFEDGSLGIVNYLVGGHRSFQKERVELFGGGKTVVLDNFKSISSYDGSFHLPCLFGRQDKGHQAMFSEYLKVIRGELDPPISIDEILEVSSTMIDLEQSL